MKFGIPDKSIASSTYMSTIKRELLNMNKFKYSRESKGKQLKTRQTF